MSDSILSDSSTTSTTISITTPSNTALQSNIAQPLSEPPNNLSTSSSTNLTEPKPSSITASSGRPTIIRRPRQRHRGGSISNSSSVVNTSTDSTYTTQSSTYDTTLHGLNSCHGCKSAINDIDYIMCQNCAYKYCSRERCTSKLGKYNDWHELKQLYSSGQQLCPHCIHMLDQSIPCINTNCQHKRRKYQSQLHEQLIQSDPLLMRSIKTQSIHPITYSAPPITDTLLHSNRSNTGVSNINPPPVITSAQLPRTISDSTASAATTTSNHHILPLYALDDILDNYAGLNAVQLYQATVAHPILHRTAIPHMVQLYAIHGSQLLTHVTPEILLHNNVPIDISNHTIIIINQLIRRQHQRHPAIQQQPSNIPYNPTALNQSPYVYFNTTPTQLTLTQSTTVPAYLPTYTSYQPIIPQPALQYTYNPLAPQYNTTNQNITNTLPQSHIQPQSTSSLIQPVLSITLASQATTPAQSVSSQSQAKC